MVKPIWVVADNISFIWRAQGGCFGMLFTLAQVIGVRRVLRGDNGVGLALLVVLFNCVCLTNYVQIWEINCATFCWCECGLVPQGNLT